MSKSLVSHLFARGSMTRRVRTAALWLPILGAASAIAACDLSDYGSGSGADLVPGNTWDIYCDCVGTRSSEGDLGTQLDKYEWCVDEGEPTTWEKSGACSALGRRKTGYVDGPHGLELRSWECTPSAAAPVLTGTDTCVAVDTSSGSSPLVSGGTYSASDPSIAWSNPQASFEGVAQDMHARVSVNLVKWRSASPEGTGSVWLSGGACALGESCEVVLDGLELTPDDFKIGRPFPAKDIHFKNATVKNLRRWIGVRHADGRYEFPQADLVISGRVEGDDRTIVVRAPDAVRGQLSFNPGGAGTFTIEGDFRTKNVRVSLNAQFDQTGGLPSAVVDTREVCNGTSCSVLHDASASRAFGGVRVTRFTWQDRQGKELGRSNRLVGLRNLAYPLSLIVHDAQGRFAIAKVDSPFAPLIPKLPPREIPLSRFSP